MRCVGSLAHGTTWGLSTAQNVIDVRGLVILVLPRQFSESRQETRDNRDRCPPGTSLNCCAQPPYHWISDEGCSFSMLSTSASKARAAGITWLAGNSLRCPPKK